MRFHSQKKLTLICKICFKEIDKYNLHSLLNNVSICNECLNKYKPTFKKIIFHNYELLSIYEYKDLIKEKLFTFKGCFDYELYSTFLYQYSFELNLKYRGYYVVFVPSNKKDDLKRGFNHVREMFSFLKLKELDLLEKSKINKQARNTYKERKKSEKSLVLKQKINLEGKKILIVDDVITTGTTILSAINLINELKPKKIKILTMSKTEFNVKNMNNSVDIVK